MSVETNSPLVVREKPIRNPGIVLEDYLAMGEKVPAHFGKIIRVHEERRRFEQREALALLLAKFPKVRNGFYGPVREVGCKIIKRLRSRSRSREPDLHAGGGSFAWRNKGAFLVERDQLDGFDRAPGARQKNVEQRQRPAQLLLAQIHLHVSGDEKAPAQD